MSGITPDGIRASEAVSAKASRIAPLWTERAVSALDDWLRARGDAPFTMEEARSSVVIDAPHDLRAWGTVTRLAVQLGLMKNAGATAPAESSRGSQKPLYVSLI